MNDTRLQAAAPSLLSALRQLVAYVDSRIVEPGRPEGWAPDVMLPAADAIFQATGELIDFEHQAYQCGAVRETYRLTDRGLAVLQGVA